MRGGDILVKIILWRFSHIPNSSVIEWRCISSDQISFNEEKSIIGFPSGRREWHNFCTSFILPMFITNRSSITDVGGNATEKFPTPFGEHSKDSNSNFFRLTQPVKSAKGKFPIVFRVILVRVGKWRSGRRTFRPDDDIQSKILHREERKK